VSVRTIRRQSGLGDEGKIYAMTLSSDGRWLAASGHFPGQCEVIRLYDFATGELKALLSSHRHKAASLAFSPDGTKLISGSGDTSAIIWDVEQGTPLHRLQGYPDFIYAVGFTPDGARALSASYDTLRLWRVADGMLLKEMKRPLMSNEVRAPGVVSVNSDEVTALAISPGGTIASGDAGGKIWLWDGTTDEFQRCSPVNASRLARYAFRPMAPYCWRPLDITDIVGTAVGSRVSGMLQPGDLARADLPLAPAGLEGDHCPHQRLHEIVGAIDVPAQRNRKRPQRRHRSQHDLGYVSMLAHFWRLLCRLVRPCGPAF
jgi:WD domain, G-beta repeat